MRTIKGIKGFTLVEMVVVVAIIALLVSVVLARYKEYDSVTLLQSAAYDVALSVREAQVRGVAVSGDEGEFEVAYGIHFDLNRFLKYLGDSFFHTIPWWLKIF